MYEELLNETIEYDQKLMEKIIENFPRSVIQITSDDGEVIYHDPDITTIACRFNCVLINSINNDSAIEFDEIKKVVIFKEVCPDINDFLEEYQKEQNDK